MRRILAILIVLLFAAAPAWADLRSSVEALGTAKLDTLPDIIKSIAADTDPAAPKVLGALAEGTLFVRKADAQVFIAEASGEGFALIDPVTGNPAGQAAKSDLAKIKINNALRRVIKAAAGGSALASPDASKRLEAAQSVFKSKDANALAALEEAIARETDPAVKPALELARAAALLWSDRPAEEKRAATPRWRQPEAATCSPSSPKRARPAAMSRSKPMPRQRASNARWRSGTRDKTCGSAFRSARCCCSPP